MEPGFNRHRRLLTVIVLCFVYIISSYLQSLVLDQIEITSTGIIKTAKAYGIKKSKFNALEKNAKEKSAKEKINFKGDAGERKPSERAEEGTVKPQKEQVELKSCLPRFICEVHAQGPGIVVSSDLERDVLSLFRNYVFLEDPSSPIYSYQVAAHMGQLVAGLTPSPCHSMYPSCPLSRQQLLNLLATVKSAKRAIS